VPKGVRYRHQHGRFSGDCNYRRDVAPILKRHCTTCRVAPAVTSVCFSPDGKWLAVASRSEVVVLPVDGKGERQRLPTESDLLTCKVSLAEGGKLLRSIATSTDYVNAVAATPTLAISAGRERVPATYDLKLALGEVALRGTGNEMGPDRPSAQYTRRLETQPGEVLDLAVNAKRTILAVAGNFGESRLYNLPDGRRLATLTGVPAPVYSIALSGDGTRVATGSYNGQVGIYEAATGKLLRQLVPVPLAGKN